MPQKRSVPLIATLLLLGIVTGTGFLLWKRRDRSSQTPVVPASSTSSVSLPSTGPPPAREPEIEAEASEPETGDLPAIPEPLAGEVLGETL